MAEEKPGENQDGQPDKGLEKLTAKLAELAGAGNDASGLKALVTEFYHDNVDLRSKNRDLNVQLREAKGKIKDGDVILTGDDAKTWQTIQKIGIPAAEISTKLTEGSAAQQKLAIYDRDKVAEEAAKLVGYKASGLKGVVRVENLNLEVREVPDPAGTRDAEGRVKKIRVPYVIPGGDNAEPVPLEEYAEQHLGDFRDVLAGSEAERNGNREPPAPQGPRIVRQRSGERPGSGVSDEQIAADVRARHAGMTI